MATSNRETVVTWGRLNGMGHEAVCSVSAVNVTLPQLNISEYVRCDSVVSEAGKEATILLPLQGTFSARNGWPERAKSTRRALRQ
jgi:hypothetical protein